MSTSLLNTFKCESMRSFPLHAFCIGGGVGVNPQYEQSEHLRGLDGRRHLKTISIFLNRELCRTISENDQILK